MSLFDSLSISRLLSQLVAEVGTLVSKEVDIAKAEMTRKASEVTENAAGVFVASAILYAGVLTLVAGAVVGLATVVPLWLSAVIIGGVVTVAGSVATQKTLRNWKQINPAPERAVALLQADQEWIEKEAPKAHS